MVFKSMATSMPRPSLVLPGVLLVALGTASQAHADRRAFTRTYEYQTQPQGNLELELYNTQETLTYDGDSPTATQQQIEVEYGITHHWDVSIYQVFGGGEDGQGNSSYGYQETKLRSRYRFAERGEWPVDLLLYAELIKPVGVKGVGAEGKVIVARDLGPVTLVLNLIAEVEPEEQAPAMPGEEPEVEYEVEYEFAFGATVELLPELKLGGELWGAFETISEEDEHAIYAGPALGWAPSEKLWMAITPGFRIRGSDEEPVASVRFILGLHL
jgi:hypothetical protein